MTVAEQPAIRIRGLVKRFGRLAAIDGLDLDVPAGSIFGLIGPNGAGKTTTMQCVVTLLVPDAGSVEVFGNDPFAQPRDVRRLVGWMPDFFGLYDGLSCREYLDFFADTYRLPGDLRRSRVDDLLELVELTHKADVDVAGLSRGMQQRLSLARALIHDPRLLVLDEPASGLDPRARVDLREILLELGRQGRTILVSSHILAELGELCDRVGILEAGRMLAQGTPDAIRAKAETTTTVSVRLLGGDAAVERALAVAARCGGRDPRVEGGAVRADLVGGDEAVADLLTALVADGLRVLHYTEEHGQLERLFLSVTQGIVR